MDIIEHAEIVARNFLNKHNLKAPIDLKKIAKILGVKIASEGK